MTEITQWRWLTLRQKGDRETVLKRIELILRSGAGGEGGAGH